MSHSISEYRLWFFEETLTFITNSDKATSIRIGPGVTGKRDSCGLSCSNRQERTKVSIGVSILARILRCYPGGDLSHMFLKRVIKNKNPSDIEKEITRPMDFISFRLENV